MPTFTLRLKEVYERVGGDLGLNDYPIYDEDHRETLNQLIIDTYWYREIAHETIDIFLWRLAVKMRTIMPQYNQMYKALADLDAGDLSLTGTQHSENIQQSQNDATHSEAASGDSDGKQYNTTTSKTRNVQSAYPQSRLSGSDDYATAATDVVGENTSDSGTQSHQDSTTNGQSEATGFVSGVSDSEQHQGPLAVYNQRMEAVVNIDKMVVDELDSLFMQVWATNESYIPNSQALRYELYYDPLYWRRFGTYGNIWR